MVSTIQKNSVIISSDLYGNNPIYLYLSKDKKILLHSKSINELLSDIRVEKPLTLSECGISFLLQSGIVPPPETVYEGVFVLGIGDTVTITYDHKTFNLKFSHDFPFKFKERKISVKSVESNINSILDSLSESVISNLDESKQSFLFHSAGKDSNMIALALAKAGLQSKFTLITHKSKGDLDESVISKDIAKKLGFKHKTMKEVVLLNSDHKKRIKAYYGKIPLPCVDTISLAYPLYEFQIDEIKGSNIIDGSGNDVYMGTPPSIRDKKAFKLSGLASKFSFLRGFINTESLLNPLLRTKAEWCGTSGLSYKDANAIYKRAVNVYPYWKSETESRKFMDYFDFKTDIYATRVISEMHIRKARNYADATESNLIFPFSDSVVADIFTKMPEKYLFDRSTLKNKIILRSILKDKIDLDSDQMGKMGYTPNTKDFIISNWEYIVLEIEKCTLWDQVEVKKNILRMKNSINKSGFSSNISSSMIFRIYALSIWKNECIYLK